MHTLFLPIILLNALISSITSITKLEIFYSKENNKYSLSVNLGSDQFPIPLSIDTSISISLINSPKCKLCQDSKTYSYDPIKSKDHIESGPLKYTKGKYDYDGIKYTDSISLSTSEGNDKTLKSTFDFLSIENISLMTHVIENGFISLSYYSIIFTKIKQKALFVLECSDSTGTITLGEIDTKIINTTELVYFPIKTNDELKKWYLEPKGLLIYNKSTKTPFDTPQRIVIDSTTWDVHIPKSFFIKNAKLLLSSQCQVQKSGQFYCMCPDANSVEFFPTYSFEFETGKLLVEPNDYIAYDSSSGYCIIYVNINYASDDWILGINVLNNYYTVFDYERKQIAFYSRAKAKNDSNFIIILISVGLSSVVVLFGGFWIYKKCVLRYWNQQPEAEPEVEGEEEEGVNGHQDVENEEPQ